MNATKIFCWTAVLLAVLAVPTAARAQDGLESDPGYFPLDELGLLDADELSLEINLEGAMLGLVSAFLGSEEPEVQSLVSGLEGLRVRAAELEGERLESVRDGMAGAVEWLDSHGWQRIVRVREDGEEVHIYVKGSAEEMQGLTVLVVEEDAEIGEATVVNLIGAIDLRQLAVLVDGLGLPGSAADAVEMDE